MALGMQLLKQAVSRLNVNGSAPKPPDVKPFKEAGVSGTSIHGGYVQDKEKSSKWRGQEKYRVASEIAVNTSIVAASVHYFLNLISHPKWTVAPADKDDLESVELAKFVNDVMQDMDTPFPQIVRKAGMYRFYGFGVQEWTAKKRDDGLIGFLDIESRPQHTIETWSISETGSVTGMWQRSPQTGQLLGLPRGKVIYIVEDTMTDSPEGLGIFRNLLEPYSRLKQYLELEAKGFERDLRGTPVGRAPLTLLERMVKSNELDETTAKKLVEDLKNFVKLQVRESDTGIVFDSMPYESEASDGRKVSSVYQWGLDLLTGSGAGLMELSMAIDRIQREMARIIGTEMLMMGDKTGNRALSTDKSRNLYLIANAVLNQIAASFQKDLINPLWELNSFDKKKKPKFVVEDVAFKDVLAVTSALRDLALSGAMLSPDDPAIMDIRDMLGISRPTPTSEIVEEPDVDETEDEEL